MQVTVEISDEFAAEAQARGLTPESFVRTLIEDASRSAITPLPPAKPKTDLESFFKAMAAHSEKIPQRPDEAFTRESLYQDHD
jgi:hypothetical protein